MAWLEKPNTGRFHAAFRYGGMKYTKALRTSGKQTARAHTHRVGENLQLLESGLASACDIAERSR